jgi:hypothetical protein
VGVFDVYLAASSATAAVTVRANTGVTTSSLSTSMGNAVSASPAQAAKLLTVVGAMANAVDCSAAEPARCKEVLNRAPCSSTPHTCGPCLPGYLGDSGAANTACSLPTPTAVPTVPPPTAAPSKTRTPTNANKAPGGATSAAVAGGAGAASAAVASALATPNNKVCPGGCVGPAQGACVPKSVSTGAVVATCVVGDPTCSAVCVCTASYRGVDCSVTAADFAKKQSLRTLLIKVLYDATLQSDATATSVVAWTNQVGALTQAYWELTTASSTQAVAVLNTVIAASYGLKLPFAFIAAVQDAVNNLALALDVDPSTNGGSPAVPASTVYALAQSYAHMVLQQMSASQFDTTTTQDKYRATVGIKGVVGSSGNAYVTTPVTDLEGRQGIVAAQVGVQARPGTAYVKVALQQARLQTLDGYYPSMNLHSDPLTLMLPDLTACPDAGCDVTVTLPTLTNGTVFSYNADTSYEEVSVRCGGTGTAAGVPVTATCANRQKVPFQCSTTNVKNGDVLRKLCPAVLVTPSCTRLSLSSTSATAVSDVSCNAVAYDATKTSRPSPRRSPSGP